MRYYVKMMGRMMSTDKSQFYMMVSRDSSSRFFPLKESAVTEIEYESKIRSFDKTKTFESYEEACIWADMQGWEHVESFEED